MALDKVLVTGGAGFIGSFTVDLLVEKGYDVAILDDLDPQVHRGSIPEYLNKEARFIRGDVRDAELLTQVTRDIDAVIHLAAAVGVGQSMYQIERYVDHNTRGTATLLDVLVNEENEVKKLVIASSQSVYGEGKYRCERCDEVIYPALRSLERLRSRIWEPPCPNCGEGLIPMATDEEKAPMPTSIYAMTKFHQERMCLLIGETYGIPTVALRYFNVYGPRQALSNPYTGVCAIFTSRILNDKPPYVFEDGHQKRDFVHVKDVARANLLALKKSSADGDVVNIGTGKPVTIEEVAEILIKLHGKEMRPIISQRYRKGDVRHCYADIKRAKRLLGYRPLTPTDVGFATLAKWAEEHGWGAIDLSEKATRELEERGLAS